MDISDVARQSGLPASTLRYYEEKGLIESIGRQGLRRQFDDQVLEQLALITLGRGGGLTLDEIRDMFDANGKPDIDRQKLLDKADELDATIENLLAVRDNLRHVADCPAPSHLECRKFQRLLRASKTRLADTGVHRTAKLERS